MGKRTGKAIRISLLLTAFVIIAFVYTGKGENFTVLEFLNSYIDKGISAIDEILELNIVDSGEDLSSNLKNPKVQVHYIDVGQGDATLITSENTNILIDTGEAAQVEDLKKYLKNHGIEKLDLLIATHPHSDHIGGMAEILDTFSVGQIVMPEIPDELVPSSRSFSNLLNVVDQQEKTIVSVQEGTTYSFDDFEIAFLSPLIDKKYEDLNNISAVIRLDTGDISFLFTGDIEKIAEELLLENKGALDIDILQVAHHGSQTSTSLEFLQAASPTIAVISSGIDNSYGHPHKNVVESLNEENVQVYRTDLNGNIIILTDGTNIEVKTERE